MNNNATPTEPPTHRGFLKGFRKISWQQRKRLLYKQAWIVVIATYPILAFAYLWPQDYQNAAPAYVAGAWVAFFIRTFVFHLGLLLLAIFLVASWHRRWKLLAIGLPVLLIAVGPSLWQYRPRPTPTIEGETITVMSVNLLMINENTDPIMQEIKAARPDVLLMQEYTDAWHEALDAAIGAEWPHKASIARDDSFGIAIYSRRPFTRRVDYHMKFGNGDVPQLRAVIDIDGRDVALYNIHLLPPIGIEYTTETRQQFADLRNRLSAESLPVILAGDFNFSERTPQAAALRKIDVIDAHDIGGWGRGSTWPVSHFFRWLPGIRIDHIYLTGGLTCIDCQTGTGQGSDHRPVIVKVGLGS